MARTNWIGGAAPVAQVTKYVFAGTWLTTEHVTVTVGNKVVVWPVDNATIATLLTHLIAFLTALSRTDYPEFCSAEIVFTADSTHLILTAGTPGKPFACTVSTDSASGTIDGGASSTGTTSPASAGPNHWNSGRNWDTGSVPGGADDAYIANSSDDILYGMSISDNLSIDNLYIDASFIGTLGLPIINRDNIGAPYPEYRNQFLALNVAGVIVIGGGSGSGSGRIKFYDNGYSISSIKILSTGQPLEDGVESVIIEGNSGTISEIDVYGGSVAIGCYANTQSAVTTIKVGSTTGADGDPRVRIGQDSAGPAITNLYQTGGTVICRFGGEVTLLQMDGGIFYRSLSGQTVDQAIINAGTFIDFDNGPISSIETSSTVDFSRSNTVRTIGGVSAKLYAGTVWIDPGHTVSWGNPFVLYAPLYTGGDPRGSIILNLGTKGTGYNLQVT